MKVVWEIDGMVNNRVIPCSPDSFLQLNYISGRQSVSLVDVNGVVPCSNNLMWSYSTDVQI